MNNLDRLAKLKKEADIINESIKEENNILLEKKKELSDSILDNFCEELKQLSKYGSAGDTGYHFRYVGEDCKIYHTATEKGFELTFYLPGAGYRIGKFQKLYSYGDKYWHTTESKTIIEYIVFHKDEVLDKLSKLIADNMTKSISDTSLIDYNEKLKKEIKYLEEVNK